MLGDYEGEPVLASKAGRAFTATLAGIEGLIGAYWLALAFSRHQALYGLLGVRAVAVDPLAYVVIALAAGGLLMVHDAVHRFGRAVRGR